MGGGGGGVGGSEEASEAVNQYFSNLVCLLCVCVCVSSVSVGRVMNFVPVGGA